MFCRSLVDEIDDDDVFLKQRQRRILVEVVMVVVVYNLTYLCGKRICDLYAVVVAMRFAYKLSYVGRLGSAWLVLQTLEIGPHVVTVDLDLDLIGKGNVEPGERGEARRCGAVNHDTQIPVCFESIAYRRCQSERHIDSVLIGLHF